MPDRRVRLEDWLLWNTITATSWTTSLFAVTGGLALVGFGDGPSGQLLVTSALAGGLVAMIQWVVLGSEGRSLPLELLGTVAGSAIGFTLAATSVDRLVSGWPFAGALGGAAAGLGQAEAPVRTPLVGMIGWMVIGMLAVMTMLAISPPRRSREERVRILRLP